MENIASKIRELENKIDSLTAKIEEQNSLIADLQKQLSLAIKTVSGDSPDPQNALLKARNVLERVVADVYEKEIGTPTTTNTAEMILSLAKNNKIEVRIKIIMDSIRTMTNYGVHGGVVKIKDALYILDLIYEITDWYMNNYKNNPLGISDVKPKSSEDYNDEDKQASLAQFWREEEAALNAEYELEQEELAKKIQHGRNKNVIVSW